MKPVTESKEFWEDSNWTLRNYTQFIKNYPDKWVAIVNKQVVASGDDPGIVREEAKRETKISSIPVIFIEGSPSIL